MVCDSRIKKREKQLFAWGYRYLRLHSELLEDSVYARMYKIFRLSVVRELRKKRKMYEDSEEIVGELADTIADKFNKKNMKRVNKYELMIKVIRGLYKLEVSHL